MSTQHNLQLKNRPKVFLGQLQNYLDNFLCRHQKIASHIIIIYGNFMMSFLFKNQKPRFFDHQTVLFESNSRRI